MRDEWLRPPLSRGLTRAGGLRRLTSATSKATATSSASINISLSSKVMQLKSKGSSMEVSERRQVGDAEAMVNEPIGNQSWTDGSVDKDL
ncbi:MAG: hypothetical protein M1820_008810 [Bogoriella megaspora]|nr:MAG: hypothetical protein M1820_008810 [Bogoriella megaspora]